MIYTLTDKQSSLKVTVEIAGALVTMDVDTGASMTVVPAYIYKRFLTHVKLQKSRVKLQTYSGEPLTVRGGGGKLTLQSVAATRLHARKW